MRNIQIKSLVLQNFKGIKNLNIQFGDVTNIFGANATGKTTIADAFSWLLFGKDTAGRSDFNIKTLDKEGNPVSRVEHTVEASLIVDGTETIIKRIYKEKWTKPRGTTEEVMSGHETVYYINEVPTLQKDFNSKVNDIIQADVFKLITDPTAFPTMDWKKQRDFLFLLAGDISVQDVVASRSEFADLAKVLETKTTDEVKSELAAKKKKLNEEKISIPGRIDELERSKPLPFIFDEQDKVNIENEIASLKNQLLNADSLMDERLAKEKELSDLKLKEQIRSNDHIQQITKMRMEHENNYQTKVNELKTKLNSIASTSNLEFKEQELARVQEQLNEARKINIEIKQEVFHFNEELCECPTCKRRFEEADIESKRAELEANFNANKANRMDTIVFRGKQLRATEEKLIQEINQIKKAQEEDNRLKESLENELRELQENHVTFNAQAYVPDPELYTEIEALKLELEQFADNREVKMSINHKITELENELRQFDRVDIDKQRLIEIETRKEELLLQEKQINERIAKIEKQQDLLMEFLKAKVELTEANVNKNFLYTKFKMFDYQVNGGVVETCKATVDGVPYSDLNTAMKINCGLDIINALCIYYDVTAPIFIDNRESVSNIITVDSQVINLIVSEIDKTLRVQGGQ